MNKSINRIKYNEDKQYGIRKMINKKTKNERNVIQYLLKNK